MINKLKLWTYKAAIAVKGFAITYMSYLIILLCLALAPVIGWWSGLLYVVLLLVRTAYNFWNFFPSFRDYFEIGFYGKPHRYLTDQERKEWKAKKKVFVWK